MIDKTTPDANPGHLYPDFAALVKAVLAQATTETTGKHGVTKWIMLEGFRSQARQDYLYSQGRTRAGDIVTHLKVSNHSSGLAADCVPVDAHGNVMWNAPAEVWAQYGHAVRTQGLFWGGDWATFHDLPHCEPTASVRASWGPLARAWLKGQGLG